MTSENRYCHLKFGTGKGFGTRKSILAYDFWNFQINISYNAMSSRQLIIENIWIGEYLRKSMFYVKLGMVRFLVRETDIGLNIWIDALRCNTDCCFFCIIHKNICNSFHVTSNVSIKLKKQPNDIAEYMDATTERFGIYDQKPWLSRICMNCRCEHIAL